MAVLVQDNEIVLTGTVGDLFWEDCFTAGDVITALAQVGRDQDVTIRLNSPGGIANDGAAIHAALAAHQGKVTIVVEGVAASAASALAMAGDEVVMSLGAIMMVHDPSGLTLGTVADHEATIRGLNALATAMAAIYSDKTGRPVAEMRAEMQAETWMTPEEAVAKGYADRVAARAANDDVPVPSEPTAFDYRLYRRPPERLVALAKSKGWVSHSPINAAKAAAPRQPTETPMTIAFPGVTAAATVTGITSYGVDIESIDSLRDRILFRIRMPPMGGAAHDYVAWAREVPGVTRAWAAPHEVALGTVTVRFMMDDLRADLGGYPIPADCDAVAAHIAGLRPVTVSDIYVVPPVPQPFSLAIGGLTPDTPSTRAAAIASLRAMTRARAAPARAVNGVLVPAQTIYREWQSEAISAAEGVDHFSLSATDAVMPNGGRMAELGSVSVSGRRPRRRRLPPTSPPARSPRPAASGRPSRPS